MLKILSIEDDAGILTVLKSVLNATKMEIEFRYANTLDAGIELVQDFRPDVILLDLKLPRGEGKPWADAPETLACIPEFCQVAPVIVVSGFAEIHFSKAIELGAADCIPKSFLNSSTPAAVFAHLIALALAHWRKQYVTEIH